MSKSVSSNVWQSCVDGISLSITKRDIPHSCIIMLAIWFAVTLTATDVKDNGYTGPNSVSDLLELGKNPSREIKWADASMSISLR